MKHIGRESAAVPQRFPAIGTGSVFRGGMRYAFLPYMESIENAP